MRRVSIVLACLLGSCVFQAMLFVPVRVAADTIELSGGGHVSGQVRRLPEKKIDIVAVDDEINIAVPTSRVRRVVSSEKLATYRNFAAQAGEDAERHYQLALWCARNIEDSKDAYKFFHARLAIRFDPEHAKARAMLGYQPDSGGWIQHSDLQRSRGMVSVGGKWVLPEAAAIEAYQDTTNVDSKKWIREVERLLRMAQRGSLKSPEAFQELKAIEDPLAASAIAKQLLEGKHNRQMKLLWVEMLGRFRTMVSVEALVRTGVQESDDVVREAALEQLQQYGSTHAVASYVAMLRSSSNRIVTQALQALSFFPDIELAETYINALVTTHKRTIAPNAGTNAAFSPDGSSGFSAGGKPTEISFPLENPGALTLLKMVEPDVDYGYSKRAWREHFAAKRGSYSGDLRRDPFANFE